jgi:trimethylamine--corrinoid protein Co-methyltransferase
MSSVQPRIQILSEEQRKLFYEKALWVLKTVGVKVECPEMVREFAKQPHVTCEGDVVKLPAKLVERALETSPRQVNIYNRHGELAFSLGPDYTHHTRFSIGSPTLNYQHPETREIEEWKRCHTGLIAGLANSLDAFDAIATPGTIHDYGPEQADYFSTLELLANTHKPIILLVSKDNAFPGVLGFIEHLFHPLCEKPFVVPYVNNITPLVLNKGTTDKMKTAYSIGLPVIFNNFVMAGASTPITPAGCMTLAIAELLMGITCSQLIQPGAKIIAGSLPNSFNMSTMNAFYSPSSLLVSHCIAEMMDYFAVPHSGTSGNSLGWEGDLIEAGIMWMNYLPSIMGKVGLCPFAGPVFQATTLSATSIVLASELIREARKYARGFEMEDNFLLNEIQAVGHGGSFLGTQSTFEQFRDYQPQSDIWPSLTLENWKDSGKPTSTRMLREKTLRLLNQPVLPADRQEVLEQGQDYITRLVKIKS